ncbi:MAG: hypothetical protein Q8N69_00175 [bacterium]|nr:hypothetical protein [bacterium]
MKREEFTKILDVIADAARNKRTVRIYYSKTENNPAGWREVEPYSFATDPGEEGEHVFYGKEAITPGHIFNGYLVGSEKRHCNSFILGKIKKARQGNYIFKPRWKIEI